MKRMKEKKKVKSFASKVGNALRRAAKSARKTARDYGAPIYLWRNGKVVAEKS